MQKDEMQTHLSVDQIRICAIRHPSKKKHENIVLNIIFADTKVRPNVPESIKNSAIE